nr:hypothetical protein 9 [Elusimicrobiota bacterium]
MKCINLKKRLSDLLKFCVSKKTVALFTASCFTFSFIISQPLMGAIEERRTTKDFKKIFNEMLIPSSYGRITEINDYNSSKLVVNIQDLHCHPEVQRNISKIIESLDKRYKLKNVYVEGANGPIDTSWLTNLKNKELKTKILDSLIESGKLTGAEYYSVQSGRTNLLIGADDSKLHKDNLLRLNRIHNNQDVMKSRIDELVKDLETLKPRYYNRKIKRIENLVRKQKEGRLKQKKYYNALINYSDKLNIDISIYENIVGFTKTFRLTKKLDYDEISKELQGFISLLKSKLPYNAYNMLATQTANFSQAEKLYIYLSKIANEYNPQLINAYPNLKRFFAYLEVTQRINPIELINEEQKLLNEIRLRLARKQSEREVVFLNEFVRHLENYLSYKVSTEDYEYVNKNLNKFKHLWIRYIGNDKLAGIEEHTTVLNDYYQANIKRNECLLNNCNTISSIKSNITKKLAINNENPTALLDSAKDVVILVTGGFHTPGITEILESRNISFIVITPNVTKDTKFAEIVYTKLLQKRGKELDQKALTLSSIIHSRLIENYTIIKNSLYSMQIAEFVSKGEWKNILDNDLINSLIKSAYELETENKMNFTKIQRDLEAIGFTIVKDKENQAIYTLIGRFGENTLYVKAEFIKETGKLTYLESNDELKTLLSQDESIEKEVKRTEKGSWFKFALWENILGPILESPISIAAGVIATTMIPEQLILVKAIVGIITTALVMFSPHIRRLVGAKADLKWGPVLGLTAGTVALGIPLFLFGLSTLANPLFWVFAGILTGLHFKVNLGKLANKPFSANFPTKIIKEFLWAGVYASIIILPILLNAAGLDIPTWIQWTTTLVPALLIGSALHESAHAYTASGIKGVHVSDRSRITLSPIAHLFERDHVGKTLFINVQDNVPNIKRALYVAAGPIMNLMLGILGFVLASYTGIAAYDAFAWVNIILFGLNMLPIKRQANERTYMDGAQLAELAGIEPLTIGKSGPIFVFSGSCPTMRIASVNRNINRGMRGKVKRSEEEQRALQIRAGKRLVQNLRGFIDALDKAAGENSKVKTQVDKGKVEHAASHAIQDSIDKAVLQDDFTEEKFKATVVERLLAQLRSHENGGLTEDDEATVRSVIETLEKQGMSFSEIANNWQKEFGILKNLSEMDDDEKAEAKRETEEGIHGHSHGEHGHSHSHGGTSHTHGHSTHIITPFDGIVLSYIGRALLWITNFLGLVVETKPVEDTYAWLKSEIPELNDKEIELLKAMTDDKSLLTDRPLTEQPETLGEIVKMLNVPYGQKNSVLLVGKKGVGKSTLLKVINQKVEQGLLKGHITNRKFLTLKVNLGPNDAKQLSALLEVLEKTRGRIMLFIDEAHALTRGVNDTTDFKLADIMKPYIEDGKVTIIGATTIKEERQYMSKDEAYVDRFHKITVPEPTLTQTRTILKGYKPYFEKEFDIEIDEGAVREVVDLTDKFMPEKSFPRKAVDTLRNIASAVSNDFNMLTLQMSGVRQQLTDDINEYIDMAKRGREESDEGINLYNRILILSEDLKSIEERRAALGERRITKDIVRDQIAKDTGIDTIQMDKKDPTKYLKAEDEFKKRVVGQDDAIIAIAQAIRRAKAGLNGDDQPIASFLFAGVTGTGKTELAKALAEFEFGDEEAMVRLDMSEYQEKHNVARMIGSPPGYVGYEEGGQLTEKVRKKPYTVILLDEIEKAHPDVLDLFLQILDDGRLTDGQGQTVDFKNTIIILTSNIGMDTVQGKLRSLQEKLSKENNPEEMQSIIDEMNKTVAQGVRNGIQMAYESKRLKPEFVNRLNGQVTFNVLTPSVMEKIARIQLTRNLSDLLSKRGYELEAEPEVFDLLARRGYDPIYGARPLKRLIDELVKNPLADFILQSHASGQGVDGGKVHLYVDGDRIGFRMEEKKKVEIAKKETTEATQPLVDMIDQTIDSPEQTISPEQITQSLGVELGDKSLLAIELGIVRINGPVEFEADGEGISYNVNPNRKDGGVQKTKDTIIKVLKDKQVPEDMISAFEAWFTEFIKFAKRNTDDSTIRMKWQFDEKGVLRVAIDQRNRVTPTMVRELQPSLEPSPQNDDELLDAELELEEKGKTINRDLMRLKMNVSKIEGARFGIGGSQYWLEIPVSKEGVEAIEAEKKGVTKDSPKLADSQIPTEQYQDDSKVERAEIDNLVIRLKQIAGMNMQVNRERSMTEPARFYLTSNSSEGYGIIDISYYSKPREIVEKVIDIFTNATDEFKYEFKYGNNIDWDDVEQKIKEVKRKLNDLLGDLVSKAKGGKQAQVETISDSDNNQRDKESAVDDNIPNEPVVKFDSEKVGMIIKLRILPALQELAQNKNQDMTPLELLREYLVALPKVRNHNMSMNTLAVREIIKKGYDSTTKSGDSKDNPTGLDPLNEDHVDYVLRTIETILEEDVSPSTPTDESNIVFESLKKALNFSRINRLEWIEPLSTLIEDNRFSTDKPGLFKRLFTSPEKHEQSDYQQAIITQLKEQIIENANIQGSLGFVIQAKINALIISNILGENISAQFRKYIKDMNVLLKRAAKKDYMQGTIAIAEGLLLINGDYRRAVSLLSNIEKDDLFYSLPAYSRGALLLTANPIGDNLVENLQAGNNNAKIDFLETMGGLVIDGQESEDYNASLIVEQEQPDLFDQEEISNQKDVLINNGFIEIHDGYFLNGDFLVRLSNDEKSMQALFTPDQFSNIGFDEVIDIIVLDGDRNTKEVDFIREGGRSHIKYSTDWRSGSSGALDKEERPDTNRLALTWIERLTEAGFSELKEKSGIFVFKDGEFELIVICKDNKISYFGALNRYVNNYKQMDIKGIVKRQSSRLEDEKDNLILEKSGIRYAIPRNGMIDFYKFDLSRDLEIPMDEVQNYQEEPNSDGFIIGGVNNDDTMRKLTQLNDTTIKVITQNAKEEKIPIEGASIKKSMQRDNKVVLGEGFTHQQLAEPLFYFLNLFSQTSIVGKRENIRYRYKGKIYKAGVNTYSTTEDSIFNDGLEIGLVDYWIENTETGERISFRGLAPYYISRYGFYGGEEGFYEISPEKLISIFFSETGRIPETNSGSWFKSRRWRYYIAWWLESPFSVAIGVVAKAAIVFLLSKFMPVELAAGIGIAVGSLFTYGTFRLPHLVFRGSEVYNSKEVKSLALKTTLLGLPLLLLFSPIALINPLSIAGLMGLIGASLSLAYFIPLTIEHRNLNRKSVLGEVVDIAVESTKESIKSAKYTAAPHKLTKEVIQALLDRGYQEWMINAGLIDTNYFMNCLDLDMNRNIDTIRQDSNVRYLQEWTEGGGIGIGLARASSRRAEELVKSGHLLEYTDKFWNIAVDGKKLKVWRMKTDPSNERSGIVLVVQDPNEVKGIDMSDPQRVEESIFDQVYPMAAKHSTSDDSSFGRWLAEQALGKPAVLGNRKYSRLSNHFIDVKGYGHLIKSAAKSGGVVIANSAAEMSKNKPILEAVASRQVDVFMTSEARTNPRQFAGKFSSSLVKKSNDAVSMQKAGTHVRENAKKLENIKKLKEFIKRIRGQWGFVSGVVLEKLRKDTLLLDSDYFDIPELPKDSAQKVKAVFDILANIDAGTKQKVETFKNSRTGKLMQNEVENEVFNILGVKSSIDKKMARSGIKKGYKETIEYAYYLQWSINEQLKKALNENKMDKENRGSFIDEIIATNASMLEELALLIKESQQCGYSGIRIDLSSLGSIADITRQVKKAGVKNVEQAVKKHLANLSLQFDKFVEALDNAGITAEFDITIELSETLSLMKKGEMLRTRGYKVGETCTLETLVKKEYKVSGKGTYLRVISPSEDVLKKMSKEDIEIAVKRAYESGAEIVDFDNKISEVYKSDNELWSEMVQRVNEEVAQANRESKLRPFNEGWNLYDTLIKPMIDIEKSVKFKELWSALVNGEDFDTIIVKFSAMISEAREQGVNTEDLEHFENIVVQYQDRMTAAYSANIDASNIYSEFNIFMRGVMVSLADSIFVNANVQFTRGEKVRQAYVITKLNLLVVGEIPTDSQGYEKYIPEQYQDRPLMVLCDHLIEQGTITNQEYLKDFQMQEALAGIMFNFDVYETRLPEFFDDLRRGLEAGLNIGGTTAITFAG